MNWICHWVKKLIHLDFHWQQERFINQSFKWGASYGWSFHPNYAWSRIETTTIGKTHPTLQTIDQGDYHTEITNLSKGNGNANRMFLMIVNVKSK